MVTKKKMALNTWNENEIAQVNDDKIWIFEKIKHE